MTGVFNAKRLVIWHTIAPTCGAMIVIITDMLPWIAQVRYHHLVHQHAAGLMPITGVGDPPLDITVIPDTHAMIAETDLDSAHSQSCPHNHSYRSSSHQDPRRSHSRSFHRSSCCSFSHDRSSSSYCCHCNTPHCRPSSHRNTSHDDSRSQHSSRKQHYKPARGSSSTSQAPSWKHKDRRHKQVTIDDPPSEYYSSDDNESNSDDDLN